MKNSKQHILLFVLLSCFAFHFNAQTDSAQINGDKEDLNFLKSTLPNIFKTDKVSFNKNSDSTKFTGTIPGGKDSSEFYAVKTKPKDQDSIKASAKKKISANKKTVSNNFKQNLPHGTISVGYDYGFLPYTVNMPSPASAFKTEGQLALDLFSIPLDVTYFYSSQKNLIGLNNYFRISYNADRYKEGLNNKLKGNSDAYKNQLGGLTGKRQQLMQKMAYADYLSSTDPGKWPVDTSLKKPGDFNQLKSNQDPSHVSKPDSADITDQILKNSTEGNEALTKTNSTLQKGKYYTNKIDSVKDLYENYKQSYDQVNDSIRDIQQKIDQLESITNGTNTSYLKKISYLNKIQNFLSGVKKFEIGLCYPNYSTFLANNIPVRGINFEYGKKNKYFAFTYGTTVSTLLYNNKSVEGFLQNAHNSYNYFDFNNLTSGRKIISAKFGLGTKEGNHIFVGFLIGKGQSTYLTPPTEGYSTSTKESNVVLEADARYKLTKNSSIDMIIGKSSLKEDDLSYELIQRSIKEIFSNYRSNAFLTKLNTKIPATKTNITFTFRWIDPFFKSFGIGFIRSDNMRYEAKLDQPLTKKIRYTGMFRYEEDNLLKLMSYKNRFYSINNTLSYKIKRGLMLRISYAPLFRTLSSDNYFSRNRNSITTGVITFSPKTRKTSAQFNFLYNYYIVNTDTQQINFQNVAYYHQVVFKSGFKTGFNLSWFKNTLHDSLNNNIFLGVIDLGYEFKNGSSVTVAAKSACKLNGTFYPGFILKTNLKICRSLFWENQVEKFIIGDLFNGYDYNNLKNFPYYCSTRLICKF